MLIQQVSEKKISNVSIKKPVDIVETLKLYGNPNSETLLVAILDGAHCVKKVSIVSIGLVNRTVVHPREVFVEAIRELGSAVIVAHNHPSGSCVPSDEDIEVTKRIKSAGEIIGIPLLDHIIFTTDNYYSFLEEALL